MGGAANLMLGSIVGAVMTDFSETSSVAAVGPT